jgi:DNA invertase Pin-like site-specific DNA recombinase
MIGLLALLAELERGIILQRVNAGIAAYKRDHQDGRIGKERQSHSGKNLPIGRPRKVFKRDQALKLRKQGKSWRQIAAELGVSQATIRRAVSALSKP